MNQLICWFDLFFMFFFFWFVLSWRCLAKTLLTHCTQTIFQGGSPWATLFPNSMIVVWVLYCVQFLFWGEDFQIFFSPFLFFLVFVFLFLSSIVLEILKLEEINWHQFKIKFESIEINSNSVENKLKIMIQYLIQTPDHLNFHTVQAPKIVWGGPPCGGELLGLCGAPVVCSNNGIFSCK